MGIWDWICGTTEALNRNVPGVTAAKSLCSTVFGYGSATVNHIGSAVRGNVNHYLLEEEARSKITRLAPIVLKNTIHEAVKFVPGGSVASNIVARSFRDISKSDKQEVDVKALLANLERLENEFIEYRKLHEQGQMNKQCVDLKSPSTTNTHSFASLTPEEVKSPNTTNIYSAEIQKPEDVIRVFMMTEFMGRQFSDDLIVPSVAARKKK